MHVLSHPKSQCQNEVSIYRTATIASVFTSGVNATAHRKDKPTECLDNAAVYAVANLCLSILTMKFLEDERSEGRSVSNQLLSVYNVCSNVKADGAYS